MIRAGNIQMVITNNPIRGPTYIGSNNMYKPIYKIIYPNKDTINKWREEHDKLTYIVNKFIKNEKY